MGREGREGHAGREGRQGREGREGKGVDWATEEAFRAAVIEATKLATQEVAARNRRRLRVESLLIGGLVSAAIAIPTTLVVGTGQTASERNAQQAEQRAQDAAIASQHRNSLANCRLIKRLASLEAERVKTEKVQTKRFKTESPDRFGLSPKRFDELVAEQQRDEARRAVIAQDTAAHVCR